MRAPGLPLLFVMLLFLSACSSGEKHIKAKGNLHYNNQPYVVKHNGSLTVKFIPVLEADQHFDAYLADINRTDGSFVVTGRSGKGIPAGKYRIAVEQRVMDTPREVQEMNEHFSPANSKILREIIDETPIIIDLSKPEGK